MIWYRMEHKKYISTNIIKYRPGINFFHGRKCRYHAWDSGLIVVVTCLLFLHGVRLRVPAQVSPASSSESPAGSEVDTQISIYMVKFSAATLFSS